MVYHRRWSIFLLSVPLIVVNVLRCIILLLAVLIIVILVVAAKVIVVVRVARPLHGGLVLLWQL